MHDPARPSDRDAGASSAPDGRATPPPTVGTGELTSGVPPRDQPSMSQRVQPPTPRVALVLAAVVAIGVVLFLGREALSPFLVGLLFVYLLDPPVELLSRRIPRWLAILLVYLLVVVVIAQAMSLMLRPLVDQIRTFVDDLPSFMARLDELYRGLDLSPQIRHAIDSWIASLAEGSGISPGVVLPVVNVTAGFVSAFFGYLIIPVWAFYLLKDRPQLTASFDRSLPGEWRYDVWQIVRIVDRVFGQWVRGQLFLGFTVGIATFIGLLVLNTTIDPIFGRFALLLSIIAGVFELLPIIGPILAAIPAVLLAATAGPQAAIAALVLYLLVQQIENNLLVPKIQGDAVELHPSAVMFALVVGGAIAGLLGAILALPITAAARDIFRYLFRRVSAEPSTEIVVTVPPTAVPQPAASPGKGAPAATDPPGPTASTPTRRDG